jgi:diguanylate cyclase (GGDEF)-like protein
VKLRLNPSTAAPTFAIACLGTLAVGAIDIATGVEIHVVSLYFVPLLFAGMRLGGAAATAVALFATLVWLGALYAGGARYAHAYVWVINFMTQSLAFVTVVQLVSRLSRSLRDEKILRRTDSLTGLTNRHGFIEQSARVLPLCRRHGRSVALAYIDLDDFKRANDTLGHAYGDMLLARCGELLRAGTRSSDVSARLGGDEFAVLLPETDRPTALEIADRLSRTLKESPEFSAAGVTASVGVVVDECADLDILELLKLADAEMYRQKNLRSSVCDGSP